MKVTSHRFLKEEEPMEQFSILQVVVAPAGQEPYNKYLNFKKFPEIQLSNDLAASTLFNRVSDAQNHGNVFMDKLLEEASPLANVFIKGHDSVSVTVRIVHYSGEYITSMNATVEVVGNTTIEKRNKK